MCNTVLELEENASTIRNCTQLSPAPDTEEPKKDWWNWIVGGVVAVLSFALAVATGGWSLAIATTVIGGAIGAVYGAVTSNFLGQDVKTGALVGMISGIIMGNMAVVGSQWFIKQVPIATKKILMKSFSISAAFGGGAFAGGYTEYMGQITNGQVIDKGQIAIAAIEYGIVNVLSMGAGVLTNGIKGLEAISGIYIFDLIISTTTLAIDGIKGIKRPR